MKKGLCFLFLFFMFTNNVYANNKISVDFSSCVDGDTAKVVLNKEIITVRFLAVDTPETKHPTKKTEPYGIEAGNFTCNKLKSANNIYIEYDNNSDKLDKYNRHLVWIYVDNLLLQDLLVKDGLAKVAYLYGDYQYTDILKNSEKIAKDNKVGIWGDEEDDYTEIVLMVLSLVIIVVMLIFSSKYRKKSINKVKRKVNNKIKKLIS